MTRKQHIENLKGIEEIINYPNNKLAIQYAIDHLSREWGSRNHHRKELKKQIDRYNLAQQDIADFVEQIDKLKSEYFHSNKFSVRYKLEAENKALKSEIDHLKADKDGQESILERYWKKQTLDLINIANEQKKEIKWLSITTAVLTIVLIISLLN